MCFVCLSNQAASGEHPGHIQAPTTALGFSYDTLPQATSASQPAQTVTARGSTEGYIDTLATGLNWSGAVGQSASVTYSFNAQAIDSGLVFGSSPTGLNGAQQQGVLSAMQHMSDIANIRFSASPNPADADIYFYNSDLPRGFAGVTAFTRELDMTTFQPRLDMAVVGMDFSYGNYGNAGTLDYEILLHELAHAVGLKHPGFYSFTDRGPFLPSHLDHTDFTVMSYSRRGGPKSEYQELDVAALQYLYGAANNAPPSPPPGNSGPPFTSPNPEAVQSDILRATGPSEMFGGLGHDTLHGSGGNDTLYGGRAHADLDDVADQLFGNGGDDLMYGNRGDDLIYGDDTGFNQSGNDRIYGGLDHDTIYGGGGNDSLAGGGGVFHPFDHSDLIYAGAGHDDVIANGGEDSIFGESGNDTIWGGLGNDYIDGGIGNDIIIGQQGNETLIGGAGNDVFYYLSLGGQDVIRDFNPAEDMFRLHRNLNDSGIYTGADVLNRITSQGSQSVIDMGGGHNVTVNVNAAQLTAEHFEIV